MQYLAVSTADQVPTVRRLPRRLQLLHRQTLRQWRPPYCKLVRANWNTCALVSCMEASEQEYMEYE